MRADFSILLPNYFRYCVFTDFSNGLYVEDADDPSLYRVVVDRSKGLYEVLADVPSENRVVADFSNGL